MAETEGREQGHAHGQPYLGEHLGQLADVGFAGTGAHDLVHRAVESPEHPRKGVAELDVGIAAEGFGHEPRLFALGAVFGLTDAIDAVADQRIVEPHRGQEDHGGEQGCEGRVKGQRDEQQCEKHRFGDDSGCGAQDPGGEGQADDIDIAGQHRGVGTVDEGQSPVVVGDIEAPREGAVEVVDVAAFGACEQEIDAAFDDHKCYDPRTEDQRKGARRLQSRPGVDVRQRTVALESRGVEDQCQRGQQGRQPREVQHGAQQQCPGDPDAPAAECRGKYLRDASHGSTFSMVPSFTYQR